MKKTLSVLMLLIVCIIAMAVTAAAADDNFGIPKEIFDSTNRTVVESQHLEPSGKFDADANLYLYDDGTLVVDGKGYVPSNVSGISGLKNRDIKTIIYTNGIRDSGYIGTLPKLNTIVILNENEYFTFKMFSLDDCPALTNIVSYGA